MLTLSLCLLGAATLFGLGLASLHLGASALARRAWLLGLGHGALGVAGFLALLPVLAGPPRGVAMGAGGFGRVAAALLAAALLLAMVLLRARLRQRALPVLVIGLHASVAICGLVLLAAWASLPG